MKTFILYLFLFFCSLQISYAQQPVSIHLTEKDGLPDTEFYNILEDSKGYIWLAADKGLFRFDGTTYKQFSHPEQIGLSVFQLTEDNEGNIWFVNLANQVFYIKEDKVILFKNYREIFKGTLPSLRINNNMLVLTSTYNLQIIDITSKNTIYNEYLKHDDNVLEPVIYNNQLYYGFSNTLNRINLEEFKDKSSVVYSNRKKVKIQNSNIDIITNFGLFYIRDEKGISFKKFDLALKNKVVELNHKFPNVRIISSKIIDNQIWYSTNNGVYVCEVIGNQLIVNNHLFSNQFVTDVVVDMHSNYWFTTVNNALFVVPNIAINKIPLLPVNDKIKKISIGREEELLITTTNLKMLNYSIKNNKTRFFNFNNKSEVHLLKFNTFLKKHLAYTNTGVFQFDSNLKHPIRVSEGGSYKDIVVINDSLAIFASSTSIALEKFHFNKKKEPIYKKLVRGHKVFFDSISKNKYFATIDGLIVLDKNFNEKEIQYKNESIYINSITQTKDNTIWCSSFKNGIFAIKNGKIQKHFTNENGLLSNNNSYIKAKENAIWIAGNNGLQFFDTQKEQFKNLTKNEGIVSYNYNGLEIIGNNIYVATPEQLIYFDEKEVFKPYNTPEVYFTAVEINNEKQEIKPNYTLKEDASTISINYNALGFKTNTSGQFEYRLLGLDKNWVETKNGVTDLQYNGLSEGDYTFQIRNISTNKTESKTKEISFLVYKPFWEKMWFFILIFLLVILTISLVYRRIIKNKEEEKNALLKQLEVKNELIGLKLENLRSQMNPHFVFNALNSIQDYIINNQKNLAGDYLGKFADLMRVYLEQSNRGKITLEEEQDTLQKYLELEKLRFEDSLNYSVDIENTLDIDSIYIPTACAALCRKCLKTWFIS
ncbi:MAG: histidine kinase [Oceanihabitans sp.]